MTVILSTLERTEVKTKKVFRILQSLSLVRVKKLCTPMSNQKTGLCHCLILIHLDRSSKIQISTIRSRNKRLKFSSMILHLFRTAIRLSWGKRGLILKTKCNQIETKRASLSLRRTSLNARPMTKTVFSNSLQQCSLVFLLWADKTRCKTL